MISMKPPPLIAISSTPPTQPTVGCLVSNSRVQRFRKESWGARFGIVIEGEVRRLSLVEPTVAAETEFGPVSGEVVLVAQGAMEPEAMTAVQPLGKAGGETASKFCTGAVVGPPPRDPH